MKSFSAYLRPQSEPVLVAEGFSYAAFLFGPFWLLARRAWLTAVALLCVEIVLMVLVPDSVRVPVALALAWLVGLCGLDVVGWSLERAGYDLAHVVAARDEESGYARLMAARPDLVDDFPVRAVG
jgi:hypothetical protein